MILASKHNHPLSLTSYFWGKPIKMLMGFVFQTFFMDKKITLFRQNFGKVAKKSDFIVGKSGEV